MELKKTRQHIQSIDRQIVKLLVKRFILIKKVITYKKKNNIPVKNSNYEETLLRKYTLNFKNQFISKYLKDIYKNIFKCSRNAQNHFLDNS